MKLTTHQKKILENRKPTLAQRAMMGDKGARHILSGLGFDCDYAEGDMDGPRMTEEDYQLAE